MFDVEQGVVAGRAVTAGGLGDAAIPHRWTVPATSRGAGEPDLCERPGGRPSFSVSGAAELGDVARRLARGERRLEGLRRRIEASWDGQRTVGGRPSISTWRSIGTTAGNAHRLRPSIAPGLAAAGYQSAYLLASPHECTPPRRTAIFRPAIAAALPAVGRRPLSRASFRRAVGLKLLQFRLAPPGPSPPSRPGRPPACGSWRRSAATSRFRRPCRGSSGWAVEIPCSGPCSMSWNPNGGWALKFSRIPGNDEPFQREERAAHAAQQLPTALARRIPRLLYRGTHHGLPFLLETRFAGRSLHEALQSTWPIARRLDYIEERRAVVEGSRRGNQDLA